MIKRISFVILWTGILPVCATLLAALLAVVYSKAIIFLTGAWPSDAARERMATIWTYAGMMTVPIAFILGVLGVLPGTRSRTRKPSTNR